MAAVVTPSTVISGVVVVEPAVSADDRGRFVESYRRSWFSEGREMVQANRADRMAGTLVGLHYHLHQADYWYFTRGRARVVLHDLRDGSATDGATLTLDMGPDTAEAPERGVYIPPGVAHGFAALADLTITYLVDQYYNPADELGVAWDDPAVSADWGLADPVLSARDRGNPKRNRIEPAQRPHARLRT
jgi:dTDP-4-dehydrorhamnose 3,5-epimerase